MKKISILLSLIFILSSCGSTTEEKGTPETPENIKVVEEIEDNPKTEEKIEEVEKSEETEEVEEVEELEKPESKISSDNIKDKMREKLMKEKVNENPISMEEIEKHSIAGDCYTVIEGKAYDVSSFFGKHPGGDENLIKVCGIDATELFNTQHGKNEKAKIKKETFYIGTLEK